MDERFIDRVLQASGVMGGLGGLCGWALGGPEWALAFLLAAAWSIANLWVLAYLLVVVVKRARRGTMLAFLLLKTVILYGLIVLYLFFVHWTFSALMCGLTLPYVVMVLKAGGRVLVDAMNRGKNPSASIRNDTQRLE
ncbi:MAG: hypothetical protein N3D11_01600 [Candidatus Sumerlaeia bacterium]|nr:hypothetical protein [Candidatus Sumerlaeia bacterium]